MKICVKLICLQIFIATILMRRKLSQVIKDEISPSQTLCFYAMYYKNNTSVQI